jgi:hypothetical protein
VRGHFLDRWYRFTAFGVTSWQDLKPITVEAKVSSMERDGETTTARVIHMSYNGHAARQLISAGNRGARSAKPGKL